MVNTIANANSIDNIIIDYTKPLFSLESQSISQLISGKSLQIKAEKERCDHEHQVFKKYGI